MDRMISGKATLFDTRRNRKRSDTLSLWEVLTTDENNKEVLTLGKLEDFLQWGRTYRLTVEEIDQTEEY
jgi:hypothetical protein